MTGKKRSYKMDGNVVTAGAKRAYYRQTNQESRDWVRLFPNISGTPY